MGFLKKLFGGASPNKSTPQSEPTLSSSSGEIPIEDVRSNKSAHGEAILNLWYETNRVTVSQLRGKVYISTDDDQSMLKFLQSRANSDWKQAHTYPVPESMKSEVKLVMEEGSLEGGKQCMLSSLEMMGGYPALFRDVFKKVPSGPYTFNSSNVMMCVTPLVKDSNGNLSVQIDNITKL